MSQAPDPVPSPARPAPPPWWQPWRQPVWRQVVGGNVLMLGVVSLLTDASSEMIFPLVPVFLTGLMPVGAAAVYVGLMEGVAETAASILKIASGRASDKFGKRKVFTVFGYGLSSVVRPLMALAGSGGHVVGLRFLDRVGKGLRASPRDALIADSISPDIRGRAFSFHRAMDHLGAIIGPLAAIVFLYAFLGYSLWGGGSASPTTGEIRALRWLFAFAAVPGLASMLVLLLKVRDIAPAPAPAPAADAVARPRLPLQFYCFVGVVTLFALGNSSDLFLLLYGRAQFGLSLLKLILLWVALHLSKAVFSLPGGMLADRWGRRPVILVGWFVYALVYLGLAGVRHEWQFWALMAVYGCYHGMTEGVEKALVADYVPSAARATAFGLYHGAIGMAALPASLLFGVFWQRLGPGRAFAIGAGLAGLAAVLLALQLRRPANTPGPAAPAAA